MSKYFIIPNLAQENILWYMIVYMEAFDFAFTSTWTNKQANNRLFPSTIQQESSITCRFVRPTNTNRHKTDKHTDTIILAAVLED